MVVEIHERAPLLMGISRDDINNKVRIMKSKRKEEERQEVSPAIPFHVIRDPSLSTNLDLSDSAGSSKQNPLNMLESQAVEAFENTKVKTRVMINNIFHKLRLFAKNPTAAVDCGFGSSA
jgi:hypothetical protein